MLEQLEYDINIESNYKTYWVPPSHVLTYAVHIAVVNNSYKSIGVRVFETNSDINSYKNTYHVLNFSIRSK